MLAENEYDDVYGKDWIMNVRWSPSGDSLVTASRDCTVKVVDFRSGKVLFEGETPGQGDEHSIFFSNFDVKVSLFQLASYKVMK